MYSRADRLQRRKKARKVWAVLAVVGVVFVIVGLCFIRAALVRRQEAINAAMIVPLLSQIETAKTDGARLLRQRDVLLLSHESSVSPVLTTYDVRKLATPLCAMPAQPVASPPGSGNYTSLGVFQATAYCLTGPTATGVPAGPGKIAVDPSVIPLGTRLYVEGYGECVAVDTGGAIKGRIIDVWYAERDRCMRWGRRSVNVWTIN